MTTDELKKFLSDVEKVCDERDQLQIRIQQDAEKIKEAENECTGLLLKLTDARNEAEALNWIILKLFMQVEEPDLTREELAYAESLVSRNGKDFITMKPLTSEEYRSRITRLIGEITDLKKAYELEQEENIRLVEELDSAVLEKQVANTSLDFLHGRIKNLEALLFEIKEYDYQHLIKHRVSAISADLSDKIIKAVIHIGPDYFDREYLGKKP